MLVIVLGCNHEAHVAPTYQISAPCCFCAPCIKTHTIPWCDAWWLSYWQFIKFSVSSTGVINQTIVSEATGANYIKFRQDQNSLLAGVSIQLLNKLQFIQNATACLVTGARRSEHMTPVLRDLHWLPVRQRITFKLAVLMYKCQHGMASQYLQTYCEPVSSSRQLRSAHAGRLTVPRTRTNYGDRSFAVQVPRCVTAFLLRTVTHWTLLLYTFRNKLKTFMFNA